LHAVQNAAVTSGGSPQLKAKGPAVNEFADATSADPSPDHARAAPDVAAVNPQGDAAAQATQAFAGLAPSIIPDGTGSAAPASVELKDFPGVSPDTASGTARPMNRKTAHGTSDTAPVVPNGCGLPAQRVAAALTGDRVLKGLATDTPATNLP